MRHSKRGGQKKQPASLTGVGQPAPARIAWRKRFAHYQAHARVAYLSSRQLRRKRQKLLIDQTLLVKGGQQPRTALYQDPLTRSCVIDSPQNCGGGNFARRVQ